MNKSIRLTREQLYEKVWAESLRTLATQFGISDVALAKRCRKLEIPLPGVGYWAKVAAGKKLRPRALPPQRGSIPSETVFEPSKPQAEQRALSPVAATIKTTEEQAERKIVVPEALKRPHPLIQQTLADLKEQKQKAADCSWQKSRRLDLDVSEAQRSRAVLVMDTLLKALDERGMKPSIEKDDYRSKTCVLILGQRVPFGIRERIKKVKNEPAKAVRGYDGRMYTPLQSNFRDEHSGRLSLVVRSRWTGSTAIERSWDDSVSQRIEDQLNAFIVGLISYAEEWNEWDRRREASEQERLEAARRHAEEVARQEAEERRRRNLEQEAEQWAMSKNIRRYLDAVREAINTEGEVPTTALATWLEWATEHADSLDPLPRRVGRSVKTQGRPSM